MRSYHLYKIVQLSILGLFLLASVFLLTRNAIKQFVFGNEAATAVFILIWLLLVACFVFIFMDFRMISHIKLSYHDLYASSYTDNIANIPNRFSCDVIIDKYADQELPDGVGCMMIGISNLRLVNELHGRKRGNQILHDFSNILTNAASGLCFVGRNGGNKFLAVFEECDKDKFLKFVNEVNARVVTYNEQHDDRIEFQFGLALSTCDDAREITKLISLCDKRLMAKPYQSK